MKEKINSFSIDYSSGFLSGGVFTWYITAFFLLTVFLCSCSQKTEQPKYSMRQKQIPFNAVPAELPPPIKAKYIDPDSIAPPTIIPLKKQPKVIPAHTNVRPAGTPSAVQIPKDIRITTFGENGSPPPIKIPAKKNIIPALQPKPVAALTPAYKDAAVYNINYLSDEQGLLFGGNALLEDSRGDLWFGGGGGVVRYDGKNFFHYTKKEGFPDLVASLLEDRKGNIWMASENGLCSYDGQNITRYTMEENESNNEFQLASCDVLMEDRKGNIWFRNLGNETSGSGAYCFDGINFTVFGKKYWEPIRQDNKPNSFPWDHGVNRIFEDSRGQIWWATHGSGVMRYDGRRIIHYTKKEGLIDNFISTILEDSNGNIWFGSGPNSAKKGLSCFKPAFDYPNGTGGAFSNFTTEDGLSDNFIAGSMKDDSGNLWFSTNRGGVNRYDGKTFTHFKDEQGLNPGAIHIMQDQHNNVWISSTGKNAIGSTKSDEEISRFQPNSFVHFTEKQGISNPIVSAILEDSKGNIWFGTLGGGAIKYDGQSFTPFTKEQGLCGNAIHSILEDRKGSLWFATTDSGVSRFDGSVFTNFSVGQGITFNLVWDLFEDAAGNLWFACGTQGGVVRLDPDTGKFTQFDDDAWVGIKDGIGLGSASFHEDSQHNLWLGGTGWLSKYNPEQDQIDVMYLIDPDNKEWVEYMVEDNEGNLWFACESRLVKVNKEETEGENKFTLFTKENGLPDCKIQSIVEDKQGNVWLSSDKGLALMPGGGLENIGKRDWIQYSKPDGLKSNGYVCNSVYLDSKNRMWWGTGVSGVTMLDLNTFSIPTESPKNISLSHIEINRQFLDYRNLANSDYTQSLAFGAIISKAVDSVAAFRNYPIALSLPYDLNHLTFHFSAIDWSAPHKIKYSYYLEGLEKDWGIPSAETKADYRNLPYGTHTLKVKAIGEAQVWSETFSYSFTIRPPWQHTWRAYALYALLTFGVLGWYIQRLRRKIRKKQEQLDRELYLNQELTELNEANSRFVPHDFLQILGKKSLKELQLGDQTEAKMTILFADIRSYTTLSESMTPEDNFNFINGFLGRMGPIIREHGGFINQYLGDGIMALFKNDHEMAVKAAIEIQQRLERYNKKRSVQNRQVIRLGIGLNTGRLMLGVIGDKGRYESSVISDAVNTASRMEGLTKIFGCSVIISEKTLAEIHLLDSREAPAAFLKEYRYLGKVKVKGKDQTLKIYDFYGGDSEYFRQMKSATKVSFERAIHFYYHRKFGKAADILKVIAKKFPEDIAIEYYLGKAVEFTIKGVAPDWSGVEEMVSK